jgi:mRNA interferase YafQ
MSMYEIKRSKKFKASYKRASTARTFPLDDFNTVTVLLGSGTELPKFFKDHALKGNLLGLRECHLSNDCLLIYEIDHGNKFVRFVNIGSHSDLFG